MIFQVRKECLEQLLRDNQQSVLLFRGVEKTGAENPENVLEAVKPNFIESFFRIGQARAVKRA